jgi:hypothetical protein
LKFPRNGFLALLALVTGGVAHGTQWYAAPSGSDSGDGSLSHPWALTRILRYESKIKPGDTIYLRGGSYIPTEYPDMFYVNVGGTAAAPVTIRAYPSERATIIGNISIGAPGNLVIRDLEITHTNTNRAETTHHNIAVVIAAPNVKLINNIVHDQAGGIYSWTTAPDSETYGNLIYYNGYLSGTSGLGHAAYQQNATGQKWIVDNIIFSQFSHGIHVYGSENSRLDNFIIEGNISFNNGNLANNLNRNILVGGGIITNNDIVRDNYTYYPFGKGGENNLGYSAGCTNMRVYDNYLAGGNYALLLNGTAGCQPVMSGNVLFGSIWGFTAAQYPSNTYYPQTQRPTGMKVYVRPNKYEHGRAHIAVFNWDRRDSATVDISNIGLASGDSYEVLDAQNYFGPPVAGGTYTGAPITIPLTSTAVMQPVGVIVTLNGQPVPHTDKEFNAFVVRKSGSAQPPAPSAPSIGSFAASPSSITAGQSSTLSWSVSNATSVTIDQGIGGVTGTSKVVTPATTTTYTLTAGNASGTVAASATVTVTAPPVILPPAITSFTASPSTITAGQSATLSWIVANATSISINQGVGTCTGSSRSITPGATTTYTLTAANSGGTVTANATVTVNPPPPPPSGGEMLYNGIILPPNWIGTRLPTQVPQTPTYITNPPAVIPIDVGRQLFVDDFLIEQTSLARTPHRPQFYANNPVLKPDGITDTLNQAAPYSDGVWYDPADHLFKMWYFGGQGSMLCYAQSTDGKNWIRPNLNVISGRPNCVLDMGGGRDSGTVWMDLEETDPAKKFKAFMYASGGYMRVFYSANGINWKEYPKMVQTLNDRTTLIRNPFRHVWINNMRGQVNVPASPLRPATSARVRYYAESTDLQNFTPLDPRTMFWVGADDNDPNYFPGSQNPQLYSMEAVAYESVMVGLFNFIHPGPMEGEGTAPGPELVEIGSVGFSRDGFQWSRPIRGAGVGSAFMPATNQPGAWDAYNSQAAAGLFLVVGDELWFYYSGRDKMHYLPWPQAVMSTGLATLRRDGFISMDAASAEGTLTTRPVRFSGNRLFVNVNDPNGQLRVEILDQQNNVIAPFSKANSIPVSQNKTLLEMKWQGAADLSSLAGQPVKFRFYLTNGSLFAFWVTPSAAGASYGYVAAGGPGFTGMVDTIGETAPSNPPADTTAPAVAITSPANNQAVAGNIAVSATATDNIGVTGVQFKLDNSNLGAELTAAPYTFSLNTATLANGSHVLAVVAHDAAGNLAASAPVTIIVTNLVAAPAVISGGSPAGVLPTGTVQATMTVVTDQSATCRYTSSPGVAFASMPNIFATTGGISHSTVVSGLVSGSPYTYYVRCQTPTGLANAGDYAVSFSVAAAPPAGQNFYAYLEAESGVLVAPMYAIQMGTASGGWFVRSNTTNQGKALLTVTVPANGTYVLWGRILSGNQNFDSLYVSVDGGPEDIWDTAQGTWMNAWQWTRVTGRIANGGTPSVKNANPRLFQLAAGTHTYTFRGCETYTYLDRVLITDDLQFVPK